MDLYVSRMNKRLFSVLLTCVMLLGMFTPVSVSAKAEKPAFGKDKISVSVGRSKTVKILHVKKKQVRKIRVSSAKESVVTIKKKTKTSVKVTGVKKGSAKVTAKLYLKKKIGNRRKYTLKLKVNVKAIDKITTPTATPTATSTASAEPTPTPTEDVVDDDAARLTSVRQTKADEIEVSFDRDPGTDLQGLNKKKFDIDVYDDKDRIIKTIPVNRMTYKTINIDGSVAAAQKSSISVASESKFMHIEGTAGTVTGSGAVLQLDSAFVDNQRVVVNLYKGETFASSKEFIASVGAPQAINVVTTEAQKDVDTPVRIALVDKNGIDVTSTVDQDSRVSMKIESTDATWNTSPISEASIKMSKEGATATVTASYTAPVDNTKTSLETNGSAAAGGTSGTGNLSCMGIITCIKPQPLEGKPRFKKYDKDDAKTWSGSDDSVAKFFIGVDAETAYVYTGESATYSFCAASKENESEIISYDEYRVVSSNGDIASVSVEGTGKYCNITISGLKRGTCNINVIAKKNNADAYYLIPVEVEQTDEFSAFSVSPSRSTVSNTYDSVYQSENDLSMTATDKNGNNIASEVDVTYELVRPENPEPYSFTHTDGGKIILAGRFSVDSDNATFNSAGAKEGSYTIKATGYYKGTVKTAYCTVTVKALPKGVYELGGNAPKAVYSMEASYNELKLASTNTSTVRLKATIGGVFAGYVYMDKYDTSVYPNECEIDGESWRERFSSPAAYIGVIGDKVKFATGGPLFVSSSDESGNEVKKPAKNSVTPYYHVDAKSQIFDLRACVQAGAMWQRNQYGSPDDEEDQQEDGAQSWSGPNEDVCLFGRAGNFTEPTFNKGNIFTSAVRGIKLIQKMSLFNGDPDVMSYYPDKKMDTDYALPGDYTVKFRWKQLKTSNPDIGDDERIKKDMTENSSTMTIKVVDDMYVPTIDITKRTLTDLSESGVMEVLRPDCDMNCNISPHASVIKLLDKDLHDIDYSKKDVLVRYAVVHHSGCEIYVPLNAFFSEKT